MAMEEEFIALANAIAEPELPPQNFYLWKEKGKWWGQIEGSTAEQFPDEVENKEFIHDSVTEIQLAKRVVKVFPNMKVYSNTLNEKGQPKRLA